MSNNHDQSGQDQLIKVILDKIEKAAFIQSHITDDKTLFDRAFSQIGWIVSRLKESADPIYDLINSCCVTLEEFLATKALIKTFLDDCRPIPEENKDSAPWLVLLGTLVRTLNRNRLLMDMLPNDEFGDGSDEPIEKLHTDMEECLRESKIEDFCMLVVFHYRLDVAIWTSTHRLAINYVKKFLNKASSELSEDQRYSFACELHRGLTALPQLQLRLEQGEFVMIYQKPIRCMAELVDEGLILRKSTERLLDNFGSIHPADPGYKALKKFVIMHAKATTAQEKVMNFWEFHKSFNARRLYLEELMRTLSESARNPKNKKNRKEKEQKTAASSQNRSDAFDPEQALRRLRGICGLEPTHPPEFAQLSPYVQPAPEGIELGKIEDGFPVIECEHCNEKFTNEDYGYFKLECNLERGFVQHEECFKRCLREQGRDSSKRGDWKGARCVKSGCDGELIYIQLIKKGGIEEKPLYIG